MTSSYDKYTNLNKCNFPYHCFSLETVDTVAKLVSTETRMFGHRLLNSSASRWIGESAPCAFNGGAPAAFKPLGPFCVTTTRSCRGREWS